MDGHEADELFLSSESVLEIAAVDGAPSERWLQVPHTGIVRPALILLAGESATFTTPLTIAHGARIALRYAAAHRDLSRDGADIQVQLVDESGDVRTLATLTVTSGEEGLAPREVVLDLAPWQGKTCQVRLAVGAGFEHDPRGDWIAVIDLALGTGERLRALHARAFRKERTVNEIAHFQHVYDHAMYAPVARGANVQARVLALRDILGTAAPSIRHEHGGVPDRRHPAPDALVPKPTGAYDYAHRLLGTAMRRRAPDFQQRLIEKCRAEHASNGGPRPLRVLSLCSGAARFEAQFATAAGAGVHWTLVDISKDLLSEAARNFPDSVVPTLIEADLNEIAVFGEKFDVIMCVSGLHHIVELERVLAFAHDALNDDGELWSIGEAIGRSGNRLFDEDYRVANAFFRRLPERLRRNRQSGLPDEDLPDTDYSDATFEGIRSEEIEALIARHFEPVDVYRRNCFLWRLVDLAYADNYDLSRNEDVDFIQRAVDAELAHFRSGGRPSELHGVYRRMPLE